MLCVGWDLGLDGMGWMVIIGRRSSKVAFGAINIRFFNVGKIYFWGNSGLSPHFISES